MSSVFQCLLPRLDIMVFFSGLKGTIFGMIKTPEMPFFLSGGREEVYWEPPNLLGLYFCS